jgi:Holliday junction DNA helicase RuvA
MISYLKGTIVTASPTEVIIDVNGVGYAVSIPLSTFDTIERLTGTVTILTYLHVREDLLQLYGFATEAEREMFRSLLAVSGIGPKMAQGILSGMSTGEIRNAVLRGNVASLTSISGVGKKTAERIIIELRDKVGKSEPADASLPSSSKQLKERSEAIVALMSLGHTRQGAEQALRRVLAETQDLSVEEMIKRALHYAGK